MPLDNEFQRKLSQQNQQLATKPSGDVPQEHPEDIMVVHNILTDGDKTISEPIPYAVSKSDIDPSTGVAHFINRQESHVYDHYWSTRDFFEVRWDGRPHRINAGAKRLMPRYLADHFAKHLIDHILTQREEKEGRTNLLRDVVERGKLYKQIVPETQDYHNASLYEYQREGHKVEQQMASLNEPGMIDLGEIPNPAIGYAAPKTQEEDIKPPMTAASASSNKTPGEARTRGELFKEAKDLGISVTGKETREQLVQMITNF